MSNDIQKILLPIMTISAILGGSYYGFQYRPRYQKPMRKCLRKGCDKIASHNGGYCSPECCKMDKVRN